MTVPTIHNEPCDCPRGQCAVFVDPDEDCINRVSGDVATAFCKQCGSATWHQNISCLRCKKSSA